VLEYEYAGSTTLTVNMPLAPAPPILTGASPTSGGAGTQVTITGSGFGATQGSGTVWLGSTLGSVVSWSDTQVVANVATGFKDSGRATIIGETTEGSSGMPYLYDFHNGMILKIAVKRQYFPDGSEFEGVGIGPDIEVRTSIDALKNGRDVVLEKAMELVAK